MCRIAENVCLGTQDGAVLGSNTSFFEVEVELQKESMLGPYKILISQSRQTPKVIGNQAQQAIRDLGPKGAEK